MNKASSIAVALSLVLSAWALFAAHAATKKAEEADERAFRAMIVLKGTLEALIDGQKK